MKNSINKVCKNILAITDEEIKEMADICQQQINYIHPFKYATARKQNELGEYNKKVLGKLVELKELLKSGGK